MIITQLQAEMILEIAMGLTPPLAVAEKYGYSQDEYLKMAGYPWFHRQIDEAKKKLESEGYTFRAKMAAMAEDLLVSAYQQAKKSVSAETQLDVAKYLSKVSGLEPTAGQPVAAAGFSISINFSGEPSAAVSLSAPTLPAEKMLSDVIDAVMIESDLPPMPQVISATLPLHQNEDLAYVE